MLRLDPLTSVPHVCRRLVAGLLFLLTRVSMSEGLTRLENASPRTVSPSRKRSFAPSIHTQAFNRSKPMAGVLKREVLPVPLKTISRPLPQRKLKHAPPPFLYSFLPTSIHWGKFFSPCPITSNLTGLTRSRRVHYSATNAHHNVKITT